MNLTASILYDYSVCPHRVWRDLYGPQNERNPETNPFVQLLWDRGLSHEKDVVAGMNPFDLGTGDKDERFAKTVDAMKRGVPLIYHGFLKYGNMAGEPDLLRRNDDGSYIPVDIKSGMGMEGAEDDEDNVKLKPHYALQLGLYVEVLIRLGFATKRQGIILDIHNQEVVYDLEISRGKRNTQTWWDYYQEIKREVMPLINNETQNKPALFGKCKLCHWHDSCKRWCVEKNDPTLLFNLGRAKRDVLMEDLDIEHARDLATLDVDVVMEKKRLDKKYLPKIAEKTLTSIKKRSDIMFVGKKPVFQPYPSFPDVTYELFFDIEDDPTQEFVYLHGVYERTPHGERFISDFVAKDKTPEVERAAWKQFVDYVKSLPPNDFCIYYYSKHERTVYRKLQKLYPNIIDPGIMEPWFVPPKGIDLYFDYILRYTDWPVPSYSLKEIAHYLGFNWRDKTPSGALSIQWFAEYLEDKDPKKLERILLYNEDDCKATMVIKDYLVGERQVK